MTTFLTVLSICFLASLLIGVLAIGFIILNYSVVIIRRKTPNE